MAEILETHPRTNSTRWVSLRRACDILGVDESTLRRWADTGRLRVYRTPGGHRRFLLSDLESMVAGDNRHRGGEEIERIAVAKIRRQLQRERQQEHGWYNALTESNRDLLRDLGRGTFQAFSAGTRPNTELNPFALEVLQRNGHDVSGLRSKHVSEFQQPGAPVMDFVFTVCHTAAAEECPPWPGQPITGHWGLPDPVKAQGTDAAKGLVFAQTYGALRRRVLVPLRPAYGAEQDGIGLAAGFDGGGRQRIIGGIQRCATDQLLVQFKPQAKARSH